MVSSRSYESIVLRTYDIGEADRFCIFFTRERGRLAARAAAVRKPRSKAGPLVLSLRHVTVDLVETDSGFILRSASLPENSATPPTGLHDFTRATEGMELLLLLLEDDEPLPALFDATLAFLRTCGDKKYSPLAYTFSVLHQLGFLPSLKSSFFEECETSDHDFLRRSLSADFFRLPELAEHSRLPHLAEYFLRDHLPRARKAHVFAGTI